MVGPNNWKARSVNWFDEGLYFRRYMEEHCGLRPDSDLLDVGCGCGRLAVGLTSYLVDGHFAGFDADARAIRWCWENIGHHYDRFAFVHADTYNGFYNPRGTVKPTDFFFPYPERCFDIVTLVSVFTHMLPDDVAHYLDEINRVLRPGGRMLATMFLVNDRARDAIAGGTSTLGFKPADGFWTSAPAQPEQAVAYDESDFLNLVDLHGLPWEFSDHGNWYGRESDSYQDILICRKE